MFLNTKSEIDRKAYNKPHNFCVTFTTKAKETFLSNINNIYVTNNKTFWKTVKPFFTDIKLGIVQKKDKKAKHRRSHF